MKQERNTVLPSILAVVDNATFRPIISFFYQLFKLTNFEPCHNQQSTTRASFSHLFTPQNSFFFIRTAANRRLKVSENIRVMPGCHVAALPSCVYTITTSGFTITFLDYFPLFFFFSQKWIILRKRIEKLRF